MLNFFHVESQGFTAAGEMGIGTSIVTRAGPVATLASSQVRDQTATVYNFEVENTHTYFVGHSELWVHNTCFHAINWKGFSKGKLKEHFEKHVVQQEEFGDITQNEYLKRALNFAKEEGPFTEISEGNFLIKYDPSTKRMIIGHESQREIRTFYIADGRSANPLQDAIEFAKSLGGGG